MDTFGQPVHRLRESLASVPASILFRGDVEKSREQGTILFYHGLGASKDAQEKEIASLAEHGFLAVGLDNVGHGERRYVDFERRFSLQNPNLEYDFTQAVRETAAEIPAVVDALLEKRLANPDKIGICGISMGGYIVYSALLVERRIRAAVSILGSPQWKTGDPQSPHHFPERFFPVAFLALNAGADRSVPPRFAREFHRKLEPFYAASPDRLRYVEYPGADHFMPPKEWDDLWQKTVRWFLDFLPVHLDSGQAS